MSDKDKMQEILVKMQKDYECCEIITCGMLNEYIVSIKKALSKPDYQYCEGCNDYEMQSIQFLERIKELEELSK